MQTFNNKLNIFGDWVYRLVILNFLWIGFAILGLGILGIFPATNALFSLLRKWFMNKEVKIVADFYHYYRKDFWKSNALGYSILAISAILWIDYRYFMSLDNFSMFVIGNVMLVLFVFSILSLCILFPIFSHYKLSFGQYVKNILLYPFTHLLTMIILAAAILIFDFIVNKVPGFLPFIGISFPCFLIMKILFPTFQNQKQPAKGWFKAQKDKSLYY